MGARVARIDGIWLSSALDTVTTLIFLSFVFRQKTKKNHSKHPGFFTFGTLEKP